MEENQSTTPIPAPKQTPPKTKMVFFPWIIIIFLLSAFSLLLYRNMNLMQQISELQKMTSVTPTPATNPMVDWKTFIISEINLEFKLPDVILVDGELEKFSVPSDAGSAFCWQTPFRQSFFVNTVLAGGAPCSVNRFTIGVSSFDFEAGRMSGFSDVNSIEDIATVPQMLITKLTNPNGLNITKILGKNNDQLGIDTSNLPVVGTPGDGVIGAIIESTNQKYPIISVQMALNDNQTENLFDQILSTFVFTQ